MREIESIQEKSVLVVGIYLMMMMTTMTMVGDLYYNNHHFQLVGVEFEFWRLRNRKLLRLQLKLEPNLNFPLFLF